MSDIKKTIKISDYQDIRIPDEFELNNNIKNLLELSASNNINIFNNKKKTKLKTKKSIIKDCKKLKKLKIIEFSKELSNITENETDTNIIKKKNSKYIDNIESIDSIINIIDKNDSELDILNNILSKSTEEEYIETYSNS